MVGYRMLFGVPDEITDVTRVSGVVRKQRLIYRMTSFDYRKVFGVTGNDEWVPGVHRGGQPTPGKPIGLGVAHQPLVGWWDSPRRPYAP